MSSYVEWKNSEKLSGTQAEWTMVISLVIAAGQTAVGVVHQWLIQLGILAVVPSHNRNTHE